MKSGGKLVFSKKTQYFRTELLPVIYRRKERQNQVNPAVSYNSPESSSENGVEKTHIHNILGQYQT